MRSVVVVLPASMCAMMPMLRTFSRGYSRAVISLQTFFYLPAIVGEGLVGLSLLGHVLTALDGRPHTVGGVDDLVSQTVGHGLLATLLREVGQPSYGERRRTTRANLDGHLVRSATDAATANFELRTDVLERALQCRDRVGTGLLFYLLEGRVDDALGDGALAALQDLVRDLRDEDRLVDRVDGDLTTYGRTFTRHYFSLLAP